MGESSPARRWSGWVTVAWAAAFAYLGLTGDPPALPDVAWDVDLLGHALACTLLTLLVAEWLAATSRWSAPTSSVAATVASFGYGLLIEVVQTTRPVRSFEWPDVVADLVGAVGGALAYAGMGRLVEARLRSRLLVTGGVLAVLASAVLVGITA